MSKQSGIQSIPKQFKYIKETNIQFQSLEEIEQQGLSIIYPGVTPYTNDTNLKKILIQKHISQAELSRALCIQQGTLGQWIRNPDTMPLQYALKIAQILNSSVDEIFKLTDDAWSFLYPIGENYYLDLYTLKMVPVVTVRSFGDGCKWYDTRSKEIITVKERRLREIKYVDDHMQNPQGSKQTKTMLQAEFAHIVVPRYVRLVRATEPFTL